MKPLSGALRQATGLKRLAVCILEVWPGGAGMSELEPGIPVPENRQLTLTGSKLGGFIGEGDGT